MLSHLILITYDKFESMSIDRPHQLSLISGISVFWTSNIAWNSEFNLVICFPQGYVSQDRRKQQRKEEDDRLALMLDSSSEGEMEEEGGINEGEGTHYDGRSETQFQTLLETSEVLIKCGKSMEAFDLLRDSLFRFSKRWQSRYSKKFSSSFKFVSFLQALFNVICMFMAWKFQALSVLGCYQNLILINAMSEFSDW